MNEVRAKAAKKKGPMKLRSINIEFGKGGGFSVTKHLVRDNADSWDPGNSESDGPYFFTEPGAALTYLEKCMGEEEHAAHELYEG